MLVLRESFFPRFEAQAARFLLDLVDLGPTTYKRPALLVLRSLMPYLSTRPAAGLSQLDLIGPLFRLLGSEFTDDTLLILEGTVQAEMLTARCVAPPHVELSCTHGFKADVAWLGMGPCALRTSGTLRNPAGAPTPTLGVDAWTGRTAWWAQPSGTQQTVRWQRGQVRWEHGACLCCC